MCTVSYIHTGKNSFILTSNRDENPKRGTDSPDNHVTIIGNESLIFPKDQLAGGTWIATSKKNQTACLLNGAFVKHKHHPPYRKSRGLILLDFFQYKDPIEFNENIDLNEIEPFTMVMISEYKLYVLKYDGVNKHFKMLDAESNYIWSSATLYDNETAEKKENKFKHWILKEENKTPESILQFHGLNNTEGFILNKDHVKTVSITSVYNNGKKSEMQYHDLLSSTSVSTIISIEND